MHKAKFWFDCVGMNRKHLPEFEAAIDNAKEVTRDAFMKKVYSEDINTIAVHLGYYVGKHPFGGLRLSEDYHVRYYSSKMYGKMIWFMKHSSIEYVFRRPE